VRDRLRHLPMPAQRPARPALNQQKCGWTVSPSKTRAGIHPPSPGTFALQHEWGPKARRASTATTARRQVVLRLLLGSLRAFTAVRPVCIASEKAPPRRSFVRRHRSRGASRAHRYRRAVRRNAAAAPVALSHTISVWGSLIKVVGWVLKSTGDERCVTERAQSRPMRRSASGCEP
jgi:hypothetical protein